VTIFRNCSSSGIFTFFYNKNVKKVNNVIRIKKDIKTFLFATGPLLRRVMQVRRRILGRLKMQDLRKTDDE